MNKILVSCTSFLVLAMATHAQSQTPTPSTAPPTSPPPASATQHPPLAGKNSFTEAQAKARLENAGYVDVTDLSLDNEGIWRARATKAGKQTSIALDFKGNITPTSP